MWKPPDNNAGEGVGGGEQSSTALHHSAVSNLSVQFHWEITERQYKYF